MLDKESITMLDVQAVNDQVQANLLRSTEVVSLAENNLLAKLLEYDKDVVALCLGKLGVNLRKFAEQVDNQHPLVHKLHDGAFTPSQGFYSEVYETLQLSNTIKDLGLKTIPAMLQSVHNENGSTRTRATRNQIIMRTLLKPPPSILISAKARNFAREVANSKEIKASFETTPLSDAWTVMPDTFLPYVRLGEGFKSTIVYNEKIISRLDEMGLAGQSQSLKQRNAELKSLHQDHYHGFVRLQMREAALILAKVHGYVLAPNKTEIQIPSEAVQFSFSDEKRDPLLQGKRGHLNYGPRAYPLPKLPVPLSKSAVELIASLESHPDTNGRPIFDQYWIIVPGAALSPSKNGYSWGVGNEVISCPDYWEAHKSLDAHLIRSQAVMPIIMGENMTNRKCYFVGYLT